MHKFPFPLRVADHNGKPRFGFYDALDHFIYQGDDARSRPELGVSLYNARYLDDLNRLLEQATRAAVQGAADVVVAELKTGALPGHFFNDAVNLDVMYRLMGDFILAELEHKASQGQKEAEELSSVYEAYLVMSPHAYDKLSEPYAKLPAGELRMLVEHTFTEIETRLPAYKFARLRLNWHADFLDELERDGKLMHFFGMLKEIKQRYPQ